MAAPPLVVDLITKVVVLAAGAGTVAAVGDMILAFAMTIFTSVEEGEVTRVVMPFKSVVLAISIFAVVPFKLLANGVEVGAEWCRLKQVDLK